MWIRPSDRRNVYLECCVRDCGKSDFIDDPRPFDTYGGSAKCPMPKGHGLKDFLENHCVAIERRGRLASIDVAPVDE